MQHNPIYLKFILCTGLFTFYPYVLFLSFNPDVSEYYHDYYIKRITSVSERQRTNLEPIPYGVHQRANSNFLLFDKGWNANGENKSLIKSNADIFFKINGTNKLKYIILSGDKQGEENIAVFLNNNALQMDSDGKSIIFLIQDQYVNQELNKLTIKQNADKSDFTFNGITLIASE